MSNQSWKIVAIRVFTALFIVALCVAAFMVYLSYHISMKAEKTLHAHSLVMDVVTVFVKTNKGEWPENWDVLNGVKPVHRHGFWVWPDDLAQISKRVEIDFHSPPDDSDVASFSAIRQLSPNYGPDEYLLHELLEAIRLGNESNFGEN